jgi:hypothetical protein
MICSIVLFSADTDADAAATAIHNKRFMVLLLKKVFKDADTHWALTASCAFRKPLM